MTSGELHSDHPLVCSGVSGEEAQPNTGVTSARCFASSLMSGGLVLGVTAERALGSTQDWPRSVTM